MNSQELFDSVKEDLTLSSQKLVAELEGHGGHFAILDGSTYTGVGHCSWNEVAYAEDPRKMSFDIYVKAGAGFSRIREEIIPHELGHAVQMAESGVSLLIALRDSRSPPGLIDLLMHPRVYELQVRASMSREELSDYYRVQFPTGPKMEADDFMVWMNSNLSTCCFGQAVDHILKSCSGDVREHIGVVLKVVGSVRGYLDSVVQIRCALAEARSAWQEACRFF